MQIETLVTIVIPAGALLRLTPQQLAARQTAVVDEGDGVSRLIADQQFKVGEQIDIVGDVPISIPPDSYCVLQAAAPKRGRKSKAAADEAANDTTETEG